MKTARRLLIGASVALNILLGLALFSENKTYHEMYARYVGEFRKREDAERDAAISRVAAQAAESPTQPTSYTPPTIIEREVIREVPIFDTSPTYAPVQEPIYYNSAQTSLHQWEVESQLKRIADQQSDINRKLGDAGY